MGDLVIVEAVPYTNIHLGDVIVFQPPIPGRGCSSEVIVHRVVNITSEGLITQGDNRFTNPHPDEGPPQNSSASRHTRVREGARRPLAPVPREDL